MTEGLGLGGILLAAPSPPSSSPLTAALLPEASRHIHSGTVHLCCTIHTRRRHLFIKRGEQGLGRGLGMGKGMGMEGVLKVAYGWPVKKEMETGRRR